MNPSKSLMGVFFAAVLLLAPGLSRADMDAEWLPIHTKSQIYYVAKADFPQYKRMQKRQNGGPLALWVDGPKGRVKSTATLACQWVGEGKKKSWVCHINVNQGVGGHYQVPVSLEGEQPKIPLDIEGAAAKRPDGIDEDVWNAVVNSSKVTKEQWVMAATALQEVKKADESAYARLVAADRDRYDETLAKISQAISEKKSQAEVNKIALDSLPLAKAGGPVRGAPEAVAKAADEQQPQGKAVETGYETHSILKLTELLKTKPVQDDFKARLYAYVTQPTGDKAFTKIEAARRAAALKMLKGGLDKGVDDALKGKDGPGQMAIVYYMLGDQGKDWIAADPDLKDMTRPMKVREDFTNEMQIFTVGGGGKKTPAVANAGPYKGDFDDAASDNWVAAFLKTAAEKALAVWNHRKTEAKIRHDILSNEDKPVVPGGIGQGGRTAADMMSRAFDLEDLYEKGAVVQKLQIPGTEPPQYRKISMKIYTKRTGYGPPPEMVDELGIFDISEPGDGRRPGNIYGQRFRLNQSGDSVFRLDDTRAGTVSYKLTMQGDNISFVPVTGKDGKTAVGEPMKASINGLFDKRAAQVAGDGYNVQVGEHYYRVIGQGGAKGTLLYYAVDKDGQCGSTPDLLGETSQLGAGGKTEILRKKQPLGYVGTQEDGKTPQAYFLQWDDHDKDFKPVKADKGEDLPAIVEPKKAADAKKDDPKKPGDASTPSDKPGDSDAPGAPGERKPVEAATLAQCKYPLPTGEYGGGFALQAENRMYRDQPFHLFTEKSATDPTKTRNNTYVGVLNDKAIIVSGIIGRGDISVEGSYLRIKTVNVDPDSKNQTVFLSPDEIKDVYVTPDGYLAYKKGDEDKKWRQVSGQASSEGKSFIYYIPADPAVLTARFKDKVLADAGRVAWLKMKREFQVADAQTDHTPELTVFYRKGDKPGALESTLQALELYAKNTICTDPGQSAKVKSYLTALFAAPAFTQALNQDADKSGEAIHVTFICKPVEDLKEKSQLSVADPSWLTSGQLRSDNGQLVVGSGTR